MARAVLLALLLTLPAPPAHRAPGDRLRVVATIPDLAALVRRIGGDAVEVQTLVRPGENPHYVLAKHSLLLKVQRADALVLMGLNYEHAFLPAILEKVRNNKVRPGGVGYMNVGERIQPLEVPERLDRGRGTDLHPFGNPHYNLDPENGRIMARAVADLLERVDPARKEEYEARWQAWDEEARRRIAVWDERMQGLRGAKIVVYHRSWSYLVRRYGIQVVGEVEPKPGMPPSARHLAELARRMRAAGVQVVFLEPWYDEHRIASLLQATGARLVRLRTTSGATPETREYLDWLDRLYGSVAAALAPPGGGEDRE